MKKQRLKNNLSICGSLYKYYKSSNCPVYPICEKGRKLQNSFPTLVAETAYNSPSIY